MTAEKSVHSRANLPALLGAAAIPLFIILILGLNWILPSGQVFEPPWLLPILNTLFISCISLIAATLAARSFLVSGSWNLVLMGCGMLAFGLTAAINGWLIGLPDGVNINVTVYNLGALVASILHLAGAATTFRGAYSPATRKLRGRQILFAYLSVLLLVVFIVLSAVMHWLPTFFVQGVGATPLRQGVLGTAVTLFALSAVLFGRLYFRARSRFLYWYALALALIAVGLGAVFIIRMIGGPVGWLGRIAQYLGGLYFLFAILATVQSARQQKAPLDQAMAELFRRPEEHYRAIVETVSDAIISCDAEGRILLWNAAAVHSFGFSRQEAIGARLIDLIVPEEQAPRMREAMAQWSQTGSGPAIGKSTETMARRKDGSIFPIEVSGSCRLVRQLWFTTFVIRDITARKEAALELFQVQQMIRLVLDTVPQRIFWKDRNLRFLGCNRSFAADAGYKDPQQIIGLDDHALSWKEMADPYQSNDNWVMENDQAKLNFEEPQQREDGTLRWLKTSLVPLHDEAGKVVGVLGTYEDITERKKLEEALQLKNLVFDVSIAANSIAGLDGVITEANDAFQQIWGYPSKDEVIGKPIVHFLNDPNEALAIVTALNETGQWEGDYTAKRGDGSTFIAHGLATVVRDGNGIVIGNQSAVIDITERKRAEEALADAHSQLAATVKAIPDILFEVDREGRIHSYQAPEKSVLYVPPEVFLGKTFAEVLPEGPARIIREALEEAIRQGWHRGAVYELDLPTGRSWFELSIATKGEVGALGAHFIVLARDISQRRLFEENLRHSEQLFRLVFENSPLGKSLTGVDGSLKINKAFGDLLGYTEEELQGTRWQEITYPDDILESEQVVADLLAGS